MGQHYLDHPGGSFPNLLYYRFRFLLPFCGTSLLWNIPWETFFTHRSLSPILIRRALWGFIISQVFLHIMCFLIPLMECLKSFSPWHHWSICKDFSVVTEPSDIRQKVSDFQKQQDSPYGRLPQKEAVSVSSPKPLRWLPDCLLQ